MLAAPGVLLLPLLLLGKIPGCADANTVPAFERNQGLRSLRTLDASCSARGKLKAAAASTD